MNEEIKKITKHYCGKCKEELKSVSGGFDAFNFFFYSTNDTAPTTNATDTVGDGCFDSSRSKSCDP